MPQQTHDLRALSREWFERVWNQRDAAAIDELCQPHVVIHGLGDAPGHTGDVDHFRAFHANFIDALPDLKIRVDDVLVDGQKTAIRFTLTATHVGEGLGVPPSNKPVRVTGMSITRWEDGKIAEGWNEFDKAGLAAQIAPGPH
jgi:steroid delta-isomerase-like uncharacterized protein